MTSKSRTDGSDVCGGRSGDTWATSAADCDLLEDCHADAVGTYDDIGTRHVCVCRDGFAGDGLHCQPSLVGCNVINNCHADAACLYDDNAIGFRCQCKEVTSP